MKQIRFAQRLLNWYDRNGRKDLPWKKRPNSYRVWVSEIMLQQTQVATVIPYYQRFMQRFPTVSALADADIDAVLHLWSGLGYYARARNLHKAAQLVCEQHGGRFPRDIEILMALPGIGRSTAGAILALAQDQRHAILDGNVKRVLARFYAVEGWTGQREILERLWQLSEQLTPQQRVADYTQAIMDLGAMVCTRSQPDCLHCPVQPACRAFLEDRVTEFPSPKPRKSIPTRNTVMLLIADRMGRVLLEQRPPAGIWGGLWSLPECDNEGAVDKICRQQFGVKVMERRKLEPLQHTFSHFRLNIQPLQLDVEALGDTIAEKGSWIWQDVNNPTSLGMAAPVERLLQWHADQLA